ncbi:YihY family inner membrane protein [Telmatospirillum sp. J64-1]|uniref:YihY family inner membrane protein n=1 Tax=Telmatospirillum sp. J64-1 TaxID=2502183 RepID=UPI00163D5EB5|nr:YihY family inner membrane protein [Telmatospirillum sp. J64-1]
MSGLKERLHSLHERIPPKIRHHIEPLWSFPYFVAKRSIDDEVTRAGASLSYTSLLALVPLLAVGLAVLTAFPAFEEAREQLQTALFDLFVPDVGLAVQEQVLHFVANTAQLTAAGIVGLAFVSIMLLVTIEMSLNQIFRVTQARSTVSRLLVYWTALTLGPLLVGSSFSIWGYLTAFQEWMGFSRMTHIIARPLPTLLIAAAFTVLYVAVPNRNVRVSDALLGALVAALAFSILRWGFSLYVANTDFYRTVYGAIAAVPFFLLWMYLSWTVVLIGAEIAAALPEWRAQRAFGPGPLPARRRLALALDVLAILQKAAIRGSGGVGRRVLLDHTTAAEGALLAVLDKLMAQGFVARGSGSRYLLSRDLHAVTLYDLVRALDLGVAPEQTHGVRGAWRERLEERVAAACEAERRSLDIPLWELLSTDLPESGGRMH